MCHEHASGAHDVVQTAKTEALERSSYKNPLGLDQHEGSREHPGLLDLPADLQPPRNTPPDIPSVHRLYTSPPKYSYKLPVKTPQATCYLPKPEVLYAGRNHHIWRLTRVSTQRF